ETERGAETDADADAIIELMEAMREEERGQQCDTAAVAAVAARQRGPTNLLAQVAATVEEVEMCPDCEPRAGELGPGNQHHARRIVEARGRIQGARGLTREGAAQPAAALLVQLEARRVYLRNPHGPQQHRPQGQCDER